MNEQIQELALRANLKLDELPDDIVIPLEKFAEMIVAECIGCCGSQADMKNIRKRFGLPIESNIKYLSPEAQGHHSQYGRKYDTPT